MPRSVLPQKLPPAEGEGASISDHSSRESQGQVPHITCLHAQEAGGSWEIGTETGDPLQPEVFAEEVLGSDDPTSAAVGPQAG